MKIDFKKLQDLADKISDKKLHYDNYYGKISKNPKYPGYDPDEDIKKQKELQDMINKFYEYEALERKRKNVCLLCGEEVASHPMVCQDCKRVFAAFKSILVEEKDLSKSE